MHPPSVIAHTYTYTRDVLLHIVEELMKLLHLDALLPMPIGQSARGKEIASEEPEQWTMTVESYVPPRRPSTSQPEQELPVAHEAYNEKRDEEREADVPDAKPTRVDKLGDVVATEQPERDQRPVVHDFLNEKRTTSDANFVKPTRVDKLGDVIAVEHPERAHTSLITSPHLTHTLPNKDVTVETPEVCESKPGHLERTQSTHDVLADTDESTKSLVTDKPMKSLTDAPSSLKLTKGHSTERNEDLDRVSTESNATDDTEDDRMHSLDKVFPMTDEHDAKRRRLEDATVTPTSTSSRGARSDAAVAKSKTLEWPTSSSSEDDEFSLEERFTSPRFMPTMGQATYFSM